MRCAERIFTVGEGLHHVNPPYKVSMTNRSSILPIFPWETIIWLIYRV